DYHGATVSIRQRLAGVTWDFNYTFSKSLDTASGLQTGSLFGSTFILNAFKLKDSRALSDFDLKHVINFNSIWDIPLGRGRAFGKDMNKVLNGFLGGWQLSSVFRYDSGYPFTGGYFDSTGWQTNWNIRSYNMQLSPVSTGTFFGPASASCKAQTSVPQLAACAYPNLFSNTDAAYSSFR